MYTNDRRTGPAIHKPARYAAAVVCLCLGVVGLVLPLLPGIPLLIVGALLLRRPRRQASDLSTPIRSSATGLSALEQVQLRFWLLARHITTRAESLRVARRARQRGY